MLKHIFLTLVLVLSLAPKTYAEPEDDSSSISASSTNDEDLQNYDSIVKDLSKPPVQARSQTSRSGFSAGESFENTTIHAGVAYANMFETLETNGNKTYLNQGGIQIALGIDLFTEHFSAEGTLATYADTDYQTSHVGVKEFALLFFGKTKIAPMVNGRLGAGVAGRYLTVTQGPNSVEYTTPSSVLAGGVDVFINDALSVGGEISLRNAMTGDTADVRSYSALLRLDTHF